MKGSAHLTVREEEKLPDRIKEFLRMADNLAEFQKQYAEFQGRLAHDIGKKKIAVSWGGGRVIESDGRNLKIVDTDITVLS